MRDHGCVDAIDAVDAVARARIVAEEAAIAS